MKRLPGHLAAIASLAVGATVSNAAIIFQDTFSASGNLSGTAPATRPGSETWFARTTAPATASGSGVLSAPATTMSYLAWTPADDQIYSLSVDIRSPGTPNTSHYGGVGFFNSTATTANTYAVLAPTTPWAFIRVGNSDSNLIGDVAFRSTGGGGVETNTNYTVTTSHKLEVILNTNDTSATAGIQWSASFFVDNVQIGSTVTYNAADTTALRDAIDYIGITSAASEANPIIYDNFILQTIPEPGTTLLTGLGLGGLLLRRRKI